MHVMASLSYDRRMCSECSHFGSRSNGERHQNVFDKRQTIVFMPSVAMTEGSLLAFSAQRLLKRHPDKVPVFCAKANHSDLPTLTDKKFLVPGSMYFGEFKYLIHKRLTQEPSNSTSAVFTPEKTIYLDVHGCYVKSDALMSDIYEQLNDDCGGILYVTYRSENTFGSLQPVV